MSESNKVTEKDVAKYLYDELVKDGTLYQVDAVENIKKKFGDKFVYENDNFNDAISKKVLSEFSKYKKASKDEIEWDRRDKCWVIYKNPETLDN
jgi:hypothetical protein